VAVAPLLVPIRVLAASLTCTADVADARRVPVLLLAGTGIDSGNNFSWNWEPALTKAGEPWCTSDVPDGSASYHNYADMQVRGEYVTYAIRTVNKAAHLPHSSSTLTGPGEITNLRVHDRCALDMADHRRGDVDLRDGSRASGWAITSRFEIVQLPVSMSSPRPARSITMDEPTRPPAACCPQFVCPNPAIGTRGRYQGRLQRCVLRPRSALPYPLSAPAVRCRSSRNLTASELNRLRPR